MKTIRARLTVGIMTLCLSGMIIITGINYTLARKTLTNETLDKNLNMVKYNAEVVNEILENSKTVVKTTSTAISTVDDKELLRPLLTTFLKENTNLVDVYAGLDDGTSFFGTDYTTTDLSYDRPWYKVAAETPGEIISTAPYIDADVKSLVVTFAVMDGTIEGKKLVTALDMKLEELKSIITNIQLPKDSYFFVFDNENNILAHTKSDFDPVNNELIKLESVEAYKPLGTHDFSAEPSLLLKDYDGIKRYFTEFTISATGWKAFIAIPESYILKASDNLITTTIPALFLMIIVTFFITGSIVKRLIIKPINNLKYATNAIASGNLAINLNTNTGDEFSVLFRDFKKLSETVSILVDEICSVSSRQGLGETEARVDITRFEGAYQTLAEEINNIVSGSIFVIGHTSKCIKGFAEGNFDVSFMSLPGDLADFSASIEALRENLKSVNKEIQNIAKEASRGNLEIKAQTGDFKGDWADLLVGLNEFVSSVSVPIAEASSVLSALADGDFSRKMDGEYFGQFLLIKNSMNKTVSSLSSYIEEISVVLKNVSTRDLTKNIDREYLGDFHALKDSINLIILTFNDVISEIKIASDQVNIGARQVSTTNSTLALGSLQQTDSINGLTRSILSINEETRKSVSDAQVADEISLKSKQNAVNGNEQMKQMLVSIDGIKDSSNEISKIMKVIDDIAFQTNLLALNAAVEAARAGQFGKGFAVVAEEVRNLAGRSQNAAKEIQALIEESVKRVDLGTGIALETSEALSKIVENVSEVSKLITNISNSSSEQADSISQVSNVINQISEIIAIGSKTSDESATASEELSAQSEVLNSLISTFKLK